MKKNIIALAVASVIATPVVMADAPTVYGIANMAVEMNKGGDKTGTGVNSVASRLGVKGSEDLGNGLKAVYQIEFAVNIDSNNETTTETETEFKNGKYVSKSKSKTSGNLAARNQYVGLAGGFGTVLLGRHDTPVKMAQGTDLFDDGMGDNQSTTAIGWGGGENRLANVLAYVSPSFGGVTFALAAVAAESNATDKDKSMPGNALSGAIMYGSKKKGLYLAGAYEKADEHYAASEDSYMRLVAQYAVSGLVANAMYQIHEAKNLAGKTVNKNNITASAGYKMGDFMPKLKVSVDNGDNSFEGTYIGAGLNYSLGKSTTAYVELNQFDKKMAANNGNGTKDYLATAIGLQHKF